MSCTFQEGRMVSGLIPLCQISAYVDNSSLKNEGKEVASQRIAMC